MNFIEGLPKSLGFDSILVVEDHLNKIVHFFALSHPFLAKKMASMFMEGIFKLHSMPRDIMFDRDKMFISKF